MMEEILLLSVLFLSVASVNIVALGKEKDKKQKIQTAVKSLLIPQDSSSCATGLAVTNGLMPFLQQEYGMDPAQIAEFVVGFQEALKQIDSPQFKARHVSAAIARMVKNRILPQTTNDFKGTPNAIGAEILNQGFLAGVQNDTSVYSVEEANELFQERRIRVKKEKESAYIVANTTWLKQNATQPGVKTTASGLQYKVITEGKGEIPQKEGKVIMRYEGKTINRNVFDSSYKRNPQTTPFRYNQVIKGRTETLTMMPVGSKWEAYIPQELAYGECQARQIQPHSTLIFTIELISTEKAPAVSKK